MRTLEVWNAAGGGMVRTVSDLPQDLFLCPGTGTPGNPPHVCSGAGVNFSPANDQDIYSAAVSVP
jgi:hypothetical protein